MEEKQINNKKVIILIIGIILVLAIIALSFAYFSARFGTSEQTITTENLDITYVDGESINITNLYPIVDEEIESKATIMNFSVKSDEETRDVYYDIAIDEIVAELGLKNTTFMWQLYEDDIQINNGNFLGVDTSIILVKNRLIGAGEVKTYKLYIWLSEAYEDQSELENLTFEGKIKISARYDLNNTYSGDIVVVSDSTSGVLDNIKIYGNTVDDVSVGEEGSITLQVTQNLVDNGLGELGSRANFTGGITYSTEKYKSIGSITITGSNSSQILQTYSVPVDILNKNYIINACVKTSNESAKYYAGIYESDIDKNVIYIYHNPVFSNSIVPSYTYLTQDLNDGDTVVYLSDTSNFSTASSNYSGLVFWNYEDSTGHLYKELTYSRNGWYGLYNTSDINTTDNTITLKSAWSNGTISKGTKVSQTQINSTYNYGIIEGKTMSTDWTCHSNTISINNKSVNTKFRNGTKYAKIIILNNNNAQADTTTYYSRMIIAESDKYEKKITIDMSGHDPLRSNGEVSDYIDYKNQRIVRKLDSSLNVLSTETYEDVTLPEIPTYDGNTIIESTDTVTPTFEVLY